MLAVLLTVLLSLVYLPGEVLAEEGNQEEYEDRFAEWNEEAPALDALIDYVEAVTDESRYIPYLLFSILLPK